MKECGSYRQYALSKDPHGSSAEQTQELPGPITFHGNTFLSSPSLRAMEEKPVIPRNFLPGMEGMEKSHPEQYLVTNSPPERVKTETSRIHSFYRFNVPDPFIL
jgi:hypothetical protein